MDMDNKVVLNMLEQGRISEAVEQYFSIVEVGGSMSREVFENTNFRAEYSRTFDGHWKRDMSISARIVLLYDYCRFDTSWDYLNYNKGKAMLDEVARNVPFDEHPWFALAGGWFCLRSRLYCSAAILIDIATRCADSDMMQELLDVRQAVMEAVNKKLPRDWMTDWSLWLMLWEQRDGKGQTDQVAEDAIGHCKENG